MKTALISLAILLITPIFTIAGLFSRSDDERVTSMVRWYAGSDVNTFAVSKSDAERLARAALKIEPSNAEALFQRVTLELSGIGLHAKYALASGGKKELTAQKKKMLDDSLTLFYMKFGAGETKLLGRILDAMPPE